MSFSSTPVLEHASVRLEALEHSHAPDLASAIAAGDLSSLAYTRIPAPEAVHEEIDRRLSLQRDGAMAPWAVVDSETGRAVGMTTYTNIDEPNRRVEIGWTWLARDVHGTRVNPTAKLLLLTRAFEDLECIAVELRTDRRNVRSQAAIEKLGAQRDGVLRHHAIMADGHLRDTVVYSIIAQEWPAAREGLVTRLGSTSA
jgi:RimJ/RimL family protein N-acetyltransferase